MQAPIPEIASSTGSAIPKYFEEADFPPLSTAVHQNHQINAGATGWASRVAKRKEPPDESHCDEDDYQLALRLQREFDALDNAASEPTIEAEHVPAVPDVPDVEIPATENESEHPPDRADPADVESPASDTQELDADLALALQLQAELDAENQPARANYNPLEKVSVARRGSPNDISDHYARMSKENGDDSDDSYDEDDDDDAQEEYDREYDERYNNPHAPKPHHEVAKDKGRRPKADIVTKHDPSIDAFFNAQKLDKYMDAGDMVAMRVHGKAYNALKKDTTRSNTQNLRKRADRKDRSRHEAVVDAPTRMRLFKMLNSGMLAELNGVISTGKESHVFHAVAGENPNVEGLRTGEELAVKIYNMDMKQGFKDRTKYVDGEYRYRHTPTQNSRKAIKVWAEKELRNLKRIQHSGILCPRPVLLRNNVLLMSFIGSDGEPAPRLKDARLSDRRMHECYRQCIEMMRKLYHDCQLVHADLSEYNMLYHEKKLYIIDVSQSVEFDHQNALEFLKRDCDVVTKFFFRKGVKSAMSTRQLFDFVTDVSITPDNMDVYLCRVQDQIESQRGRELTAEEQIASEVFKASFIPRKLSDISQQRSESEMDRTTPVLHGAVTGLKADLSGILVVPEILDSKAKEDEEAFLVEKMLETRQQENDSTEDDEEDEQDEV